jgi:hypothetical protein
MQLIKIGKIKPNPSNPRVIKDDKFQQLKKSLESFPDMAKVRPIVVNTDMVVLGGNMRLKAMKEAGWKEVPIEVVDWPEDKQREFIIKDNVGFGEWDWELIAADWPEVEEWGLDVPSFDVPSDIIEMPKITTTYNVNIKCDDPLQVEELKERLGISINSIHVIKLYKLLA